MPHAECPMPPPVHAAPPVRRLRFLLPAALLPLGGCAPGVLDPVGPVGEAQRTILFNALGIMLCIVVPVILATLAVGWWYRASNPPRQIPARLRLFGATGSARLGDPAARHHVPGRRRLDRRA